MPRMLPLFALSCLAALSADAALAQTTPARPLSGIVEGPGFRPEGAMDCAIMPSRIIEVAAPLDGVLAEVLVKPGQSVEAGQVIARLDSDLAQADLAHARLRAQSAASVRVAGTRLEAARTQYESARQAMESNVLSRIDYEKALAEYRLAERELEREREAMALAEAEAARMAVVVAKGEIRAPASGIIGEELLDAGEAAAGQPLAQLIVVEPMRVEAFVPLGRLQELRDGAPHVILAGSNNPVIVEPELDYVSPLADQSSRTIRAYYTLASDRVAPGFRCFLLSPEAAVGALSGL